MASNNETLADTVQKIENTLRFIYFRPHKPPFQIVYPYDYEQVHKKVIELSNLIEQNHELSDYICVVKLFNKFSFKHRLGFFVSKDHFISRVKQGLSSYDRIKEPKVLEKFFNDYKDQYSVWTKQLNDIYTEFFMILREMSSYILFGKIKKDQSILNKLHNPEFCCDMNDVVKYLVENLNYGGVTLVNAESMVMILCNLMLIFKDIQTGVFMTFIDKIEFNTKECLEACIKFPKIFKKEKFLIAETFYGNNRNDYLASIPNYIFRMMSTNKSNQSYYAFLLHIFELMDLSDNEKWRIIFGSNDENSETFILTSSNFNLFKKLIDCNELTIDTSRNAAVELLFPIIFKSVDQLMNDNELSYESKKRLIDIYLNKDVRDPLIAYDVFYCYSIGIKRSYSSSSASDFQNENESEMAKTSLTSTSTSDTESSDNTKKDKKKKKKKHKSKKKHKKSSRNSIK